jgi:hypothetical protein
MNGDLLLLRKRWWGFYFLAPIALIFQVPITLVSINNLHDGNITGAIVGFIVSAVCILLSIGSYAPYTFFFAFRCIGLVVFVGYIAYALDCLQAGHLYATKRSESSFFNAILGLVVWGLPGLAIFTTKRPEKCPYDGEGRLITEHADEELDE